VPAIPITNAKPTGKFNGFIQRKFSYIIPGSSPASTAQNSKRIDENNGNKTPSFSFRISTLSNGF
jgi:hypothetical protein